MKRTFVIALLCLSACTTVWVKPGATTQDFDTDMSQCLAQAGTASGGNAGSLVYKRVSSMCMRGKGWAVQK